MHWHNYHHALRRRVVVGFRGIPNFTCCYLLIIEYTRFGIIYFEWYLLLVLLLAVYQVLYYWNPVGTSE